MPKNVLIEEQSLKEWQCVRRVNLELEKENVPSKSDCVCKEWVRGWGSKGKGGHALVAALTGALVAAGTGAFVAACSTRPRDQLAGGHPHRSTILHGRCGRGVSGGAAGRLGGRGRGSGRGRGRGRGRGGLHNQNIVHPSPDFFLRSAEGASGEL